MHYLLQFEYRCAEQQTQYMLDIAWLRFVKAQEIGKPMKLFKTWWLNCYPFVME